MKKAIDNYFQQARSWSDDIYLSALGSRNRYRYVFLWSLLIISLLLVSFMFLLPLKHTELVVVHHMDDGTVWVDQPVSKKPIVDRAQVESDIVRYVINRESYNILEYDHRYSLVNLLSNDRVSKEYRDQQSSTNQDSPINRFKRRIVRSVHVRNIIYLNKDNNNPLAQINFTVTDRDSLTGRYKDYNFLALMSWKYRGAPKDPGSRWLNWDGFTVTDYSVQQQNI